MTVDPKDKIEERKVITHASACGIRNGPGKCDCGADTAPSQSAGVSDDALHWMIVFEDKSVGPEVFTSEYAARARLESLQLNWACHLFVDAAALTAERQAHAEELGDDISVIISELRAKLAAAESTRDAAIAEKDVEKEQE